MRRRPLPDRPTWTDAALHPVVQTVVALAAGIVAARLLLRALHR